MAKTEPPAQEQEEAAPPAPAPEDIAKQQQEDAGPPLPPDIPAPLEYTKAQIDAAKEEIKTLTPEAWIEMVTYIHSLEDIERLGEAPGIAWTNLYSSKTGGQMNVTSRAITTRAAVEDMFDAVRHIMKWQSHMKWSPTKSYSKAPASTAQKTQTPPSSPAVNTPPPDAKQKQEPVYAPIEGTGIEKFTVQSVAHSISKNGHPYVLVKTVEGAFSKFGVNAWKEVVPEPFETWPVGQEYQPPPTMAFCLVDVVNKPKKVTTFTPD